jgi:hypothetical protein
VGRSSTEDQLHRRGRVAEMELEGAAAAVIAKALGSDVRTIRADLAALAQERAQNADLAAERHRLLDASKLVEQTAWALYRSLPADDANGRLGSLAKVLAAQSQGAKVVGDLANADMERRLAQLEEQLGAMTGAPKGRTR